MSISRNSPCNISYMNLVCSRHALGFSRRVLVEPPIWGVTLWKSEIIWSHSTPLMIGCDCRKYWLVAMNPYSVKMWKKHQLPHISCGDYAYHVITSVNVLDMKHVYSGTRVSDVLFFYMFWWTQQLLKDKCGYLTFSTRCQATFQLAYFCFFRNISKSYCAIHFIFWHNVLTGKTQYYAHLRMNRIYSLWDIHILP